LVDFSQWRLRGWHATLRQRLSIFDSYRFWFVRERGVQLSLKS